MLIGLLLPPLCLSTPPPPPSQAEAERRKRALILDSEGQSAARINMATADRDAAILGAEGQRQQARTTLGVSVMQH